MTEEAREAVIAKALDAMTLPPWLHAKRRRAAKVAWQARGSGGEMPPEFKSGFDAGVAAYKASVKEWNTGHDVD